MKSVFNFFARLFGLQKAEPPKPANHVNCCHCNKIIYAYGAFLPCDCYKSEPEKVVIGGVDLAGKKNLLLGELERLEDILKRILLAQKQVVETLEEVQRIKPAQL